MPHHYTIDEAENILYLTSSGTAELDGINAMMERIAADPRVSPATRVLVDARELELDLPTAQLEKIAQWHASELGAARTSAIVIRPGLGYGLARMLSALSESRGARLAVFTGYDDALAWLRAQPRDAGRQ
jgi:hypothetical protein